MKIFGGNLTLARNSRGCYILDTIKGCSIVNSRPGGCYGECYAANIAKRYRWAFGVPAARYFKGEADKRSILRQVEKASMPFIRIGEMGDPSEDWAHTLSVASAVSGHSKAVVIITKHWNPVPNSLLPLLAGITVNTSISAMDSQGEITYRLSQFERLKRWCNSVLRVVSCRFNPRHPEGAARKWVQDQLFSHRVIDTVFRPSTSNELLLRGVILAKPKRFLGATMLASMRDPNTHFGGCEDCPDQCGIHWGAAGGQLSLL
jgi:hypothetical protein